MAIIKGISNIHIKNTLRYDNLDNFSGFLLSLDKKVYIFRRTSKDEQLKPLIIRKKLLNHEFDILQDFKKYVFAFPYIKNASDFYALAQHYGLATRLLDFTINPFVALFFAVNQISFPENDNYKLVMLSKRELKPISLNPYSAIGDVLTLYEMDDFKGIIKQCFDSLSEKSKDGIYLFEPNYTNSRIMSQEGLFIIDTKLKYFEDLNSITNECIIFEINKILRDEILKRLDLMGINRIKMMNDLATVCNFINKKYE